MSFLTFALLTIAYMTAFSMMAVLLFTSYGAGHVKNVAQSDDDVRTNLEQLRHEMHGKIAELESEIGKLKAERVPETASFVDLSIVPKTKEFAGNDSVTAIELDPDSARLGKKDAPLEKAFSEIARAFGSG